MKYLLFILKWFCAFSKRLLFKPSFLLSLIIIPILVVISYFSTADESGLVTIAVASDDPDCAYFDEITSELIEESSAIVYRRFDTRQQAVQAVADGKAAYAWIFKSNLEERFSDFVSGFISSPLCEIVCKEETKLVQVSSEKLYSALYKYLSKELYLDFMKDRKLEHENATEEYFLQVYEDIKSNIQPNLINFVYLDEPEKTIEDSNYLLSPLKGLLSACMLLCCLAAMMYSLDDEKAGKYAMFPLSSRFFLHFMSVFSAGFWVSVAIFVSLLVSGMVNSAIYDAVCLLMYALMSTAFCLLLGIMFRSSASLCIFLPVIIVLTVTLCPVFVNVNGFGVIKNLLPSYHYLKVADDASKLGHMIVYATVLFSADFALYKWLYGKA